MSNPIGLMIQGQGIPDKLKLLDHILKADYATVSVMDDFEYCRQIKDRLSNCVVVYRSSTFEPSPSTTAVQSLIQLLDGIQSHDKRIVVMVNCETQPLTPQTAQMWSDMIIAADARGWKLCVGNFSSGSVKSGQGNDPNDWLTAGKVLLQTLATHPGHYLGCHDYTYPFAWSVSNGTFGEADKPPQAIDWTKPQWHIGRVAQGIQGACKALNIEPPKMIITENLIDTMGDIEAHFGYKADGYKQLIERWKTLFPGKDAGDILADNHIWAWETVYEPLGFVIGTHTYCYGNAGDNPKWRPYQVDNDPVYLSRMEKYATSALPPVVTPPAPEFQPYWVYLTNTLIKGINLRLQPSETAPIVAELHNEDDVQAILNAVKDDKYSWHKIQLASGLGGWLGQTNSFTLRPMSIPKPSTVPVTPAKQTITLPLDRVATVLQLSEAQKRLLSNLIIAFA